MSRNHLPGPEGTGRSERTAILVPRYDHCLIDLLWRWDAGEPKAQQESKVLDLLAEHEVDLVVLARYRS